MASFRRADALLLITSSCPYCGTVLQGMSELVKSGHIARLEVINIELQPARAEALGVRTVPWVRIGPFELEGLRSPAELKRWAEHADSLDGMAQFLRELLKSGQLAKATTLIQEDPKRLAALVLLLADPGIELSVRIGLGAIFEEHEGQTLLQPSIQVLDSLATHGDAHIRADAAHLVSLTHSPQAVGILEHLRDDPDPVVREVVQEGLERLVPLLSDAIS